MDPERSSNDLELTHGKQQVPWCLMSAKASTSFQDAFSHHGNTVQLPPISSFTSESSRRYPSLPRLDHYPTDLQQLTGHGVSVNASSSNGQRSPTKSPTSQGGPYNTSPSLHFMSSLLRAADSSLVDRKGNDHDSWYPTPSPMSVHSMLESSPSPSVMYKHAGKRRRLEGVAATSSPPPLQSSLASSLYHTASEDVLSEELHRQIAMANPAAVAAKKESRSFQPKPLSMSTSLRRRSFIPPALLASSSEYENTQQSHRNHTGESLLAPQSDYKRAWSSLDTPGSALQDCQLSNTHLQRIQDSRKKAFSKHGRILSTGSSNDSIKSHEHEQQSVREPSYSVNPVYSGDTSKDSLNSREIAAWINLDLEHRRVSIINSILANWENVLNGKKSSLQAPITTIRCMYSNIAQKSYGSEKRFLCPPPCVKIEGRSRPFKWAHARVTSIPTIASDYPLTPAAGLIGSEEEARPDESIREVRFGKLHVGALSDSRDKSFRLQIDLFGSIDEIEEGRRRLGTKSTWKSQSRRSVESSQNTSPWGTIYTSGVNVISKPARKSVRTRVASPAIASGSLVCLYNRLNSQTVRTKYLAINSEELTNNDSCRLVARQEGWQGFSIELLARPLAQLQHLSSGRNITSTHHHDHRGITYGSIICLRDVKTGTCSDPMMVCKVEKGQVDLTGLIESDAGQVRFQMIGENREFTRQILFRGSEKHKTGEVASQAWQNGLGANDGSTNKSISSTSLEVANSHFSLKKNTGAGSGGAVVQMQKVTLMKISPNWIKEGYDGDIIECELKSPRKYLSCAAYERGASMQEFSPALFHPARSNRSNHLSRSNAEVDLSSPNLGSIGIHPVGFICPSVTPVASKRQSSSFIDYLEDPFNWTIVTISESSISYIEADPQAHLSSISPSIICSPVISKITSFDTTRLIITALVDNFHYPFSNQNWDHHGHEIWIAQYGPLGYHLISPTSASSLIDLNIKTEISIQLPTIDHLLSIYHALDQKAGVHRPSTLQLPILFVRPEQGITFFSDQVIKLTLQSNNIDAKLSWSVSMETQS